MQYRKLIILWVFILPCIIINANSYSLKSIPDSLKENANAVIRYHNTHIKIDASGKLKRSVKYAVTILNPEGKKHGYFHKNYDKNEKLSVKSINAYNKNGIKSKVINLKILRDYANNGNYSFFSDNRIKVAEPSYNYYPYTVEYEYQKTEKSYISIDLWMPINNSKLALESASLVIEAPSDTLIRFQEVNYKFQYKKSSSKHVTYEWKLGQVKAIDDGSYEPSFWKVAPMLCIDPTYFEFHGYSGSMKTWKDFGYWIKGISEDRNSLPETEVEHVKSITSHLESDYEKAKVVYEYLQSRTRYVAITLGLGGLQPMSATEVSENGYGDCKALSNYTKAMLAAIGIKSYYTIIGSGNTQYLMFPNYPSVWQANHAILTIPFENDTVFLECTSNSLPFGYLSQSCSDRKALMSTEDGGKIVRIPAKTALDNFRNRNVKLTINANGSAQFSSNEWYGCWQYENTIARLLSKSKEDQREYLLKSFNLNTATLNNFTVKEVKQRAPKGNLTLDLSIEKYATPLGSRLIFKLNPELDEVSSLDENKERFYNIEVHNPYSDTDSVTIKVPEGYTPEYLPKNLDLITKFGQFKQTVKQVNANTYLYVRHLKRFSGNYDKSEYKNFSTFLNQISKADSEKMVLKKS